MEWTTESEGYAQAANGDDAYASPPPATQPEPPTQPIPLPPMPAQGQPIEPQPATPAAAPPGLDRCASCGAWVNTDQRYCLECGQRRGEPRLPIMDAVVFMEAMHSKGAAGKTPPPSKKRRGISPNAALIAGVGTLLLALGIGVLIGRSSEHTTATAPTPQVVTVEGTGAAATGAASAGAAKSAKSGAAAKSAKQAKASSSSAGGGGEPPSNSVLKPKAGVNEPPPEVKVGEKCSKATAGCSSEGKFNGSFFGE